MIKDKTKPTVSLRPCAEMLCFEKKKIYWTYLTLLNCRRKKMFMWSILCYGLLSQLEVKKKLKGKK